MATGGNLTVQLSRGPFTIFVFPANRPVPLGVIIFGSGDGGWNSLEDAIAHGCQEEGYELVGIDSAEYARTDYDLATLQADSNTIAEKIRKPYGKSPPRLIVGGYSMGAAQAAAVAGGPNPPEGLVGLFLIDGLSRGRFGLRTADKLNVLPTGPGTFGLLDFAKTMPKLRVVHWHAENDDIDSIAWLDSLTAPHHEFTFPGDGHGYDDNRQEFVLELVQSIGWLLDPNQPLPTPGKPAPSLE